jgi:hypothetical protein
MAFAEIHIAISIGFIAQPAYSTYEFSLYGLSLALWGDELFPETTKFGPPSLGRQLSTPDFSKGRDLRG